MLQKKLQRRVSVAVIIPYFQRQPGVLLKALQSIVAQDHLDSLELDVVIIDDGSPLPPDDDLKQLSPSFAENLRVIRQVNAGPASARNTGLDAVPSHTRFIAFLDSDDQWLPQHLAMAVGALMDGRDLYFSDNWIEQGVSWFESHPRAKRMLCLRKTQCDIIELPGRDLMSLLIEEPVIHLSTLVIDRRKLGNIRFMRDLDTGEDHLYTLQLADRASKVAINKTPTMRRGDFGINFYREALDWDSPRSAWRSLTTVDKYQKISKAMAHHPDISRTATEKADVTMQETLFLVLRNARKFPKETLDVVTRAGKRWHIKCAYAAILLVKLVVRRLQGTRDFRV